MPNNILKKGQIQIMENIFVLIIVFIILAVAFIFFMGMQKADQNEMAKQMKNIEAMKRTQVLNFLPEIQCQDNKELDPDCYDMLKIEAFKARLEDSAFKERYKSLLGHMNITIEMIDPSPEINSVIGRWNIYDNPKEKNNGNLVVQTFVVLRDPVEDEDKFGVVYIGVYE